MRVLAGEQDGTDEDRDDRRKPADGEEGALRRCGREIGRVIGPEMDRDDEDEEADEPHAVPEQ
jgi:hypothetical protein